VHPREGRLAHSLFRRVVRVLRTSSLIGSPHRELTNFWRSSGALWIQRYEG